MCGSQTVQIDVTVTGGGFTYTVETDMRPHDPGGVAVVALGVTVGVKLLFFDEDVTGGLQHGGVVWDVALEVFDDDDVLIVTVVELLPGGVGVCIEVVVVETFTE